MHPRRAMGAAAMGRDRFCPVTSLDMENETERGTGRRPADRRQYQKAYRLRYKARAKRVTLTFTATEFAAIRSWAAAGGLPVAAFLKRTLESRPRQGATARMPE